MGDPTRLLSAHSDAEALERALLESLENVPPPNAGARDAMWSALAVQLAAAGAVGVVGTAAVAGAAGSSVAATGAAATTSAAPPALAAAKLASSSALGGLSALAPKTLLAKLVLIGALSGAGGGALWLSRAPSAHPPDVQSVAALPTAARSGRHAAPPVEVPVAAPAPAVETQEPALRVRKQAAAEHEHEHEHEHAKKVDRLVRESRLLTSARAALRDGDLSSAARLLRQLESEFAQGELQQERELLQIELLSARGQDEAAATRARRFVAAHPESPHSARLVRFLR